MTVVDSDVFIDALRGFPAAERWLTALAAHRDGAFCAITESELLAGALCNDPNRRQAVLHLLARYRKLPVDNPITQTAGDFRRKYGVSLPDALIAACAFHAGSPVATRNVRDFSKVQGIKLVAPYRFSS